MAHDQSSNARLLEPHELAELGPPEAVRLPLELVDPNPLNPRRSLVEVDALADNIRQFGLLQPITVRRVNGRYELLGGHRRRAAFLALAQRFPHEVQWRTVPAVVRSADDDTARLMLISGQVHIQAWAPREQAALLEDLARTRTLPEVGALVHKSAVWVSHRLKVYNDSVLSGYVQTGRLSMAVADELRRVPDPVLRREMAERAVSEQWERERVRAEVRKLTMSRMVLQIGRLARDLLSALSLVQAQDLPTETATTLASVRRRILALGRAPVIPSIAEAQRVAGINPNAKPRQERKRRRTMPPPA